MLQAIELRRIMAQRALSEGEYMAYFANMQPKERKKFFEMYAHPEVKSVADFLEFLRKAKALK